MKKLFTLLFSAIITVAIAQPSYTSEWGSSITNGNYNAASNTIVRALITNNATNGSAGLFIRTGSQSLRLFMSIDSGYLACSKPVVLPQNLYLKSPGNLGDVITRGVDGKLQWQTAAKAIDSIFRKPAVDSIFYIKNNITYAIKDSAGGGNSSLNIGDSIGNSTVRAILFIGTNGRLRQAVATLNYDSTSQNVGIGATFSSSARLLVRGSGTSSIADAFCVQNNAVTPSNLFVVRNDGFIGFGALPFTTQRYRFNLATNANFTFTNPSGTISRITALEDNGTTGNQLSLNGNPLVLESSAVEYGRFDGSQFRIQNTDININRNVGANAETSILNLNNTSSNTNITLALNFRSTTTNQFASIKANNGSGGGTINYMSFWVRNLSNTNAELARLNGNGNLLLGTTTDNTNAIFNAVSTSKGIQVPRLTTTQRNAVTWVAGDAGMIIYNTTTNKHQGFDGTNWNDFY